MVAQQHLAVGVHHLVDVDRAFVSAFVPVIEVQFRAVAIPEGIPAGGEQRVVLAVVELVCPHFAEHGIVPQGFDTGAVQPALHAPFALERFPAPFRGRAVVGLEDLVVGIFGHLAPLQSDDVPSFLLANLQRVPVAILPADQRLVMVGAVPLDQFLQPSDTAGQRMAELRAQLFAPPHYLLPVVA